MNKQHKVIFLFTLLLGVSVIFSGSLVLAQDDADLTWTFETIGEGIKPAIALDGDDNAHVAYIIEDFGAPAFYATNASGEWESQTVSEGYFYGPIDIEVSPDGTPHIAYHDHEANGRNDNLGNAVVAILRDAGWDVFPVDDPLHDGWDADIAVDADGFWHTVGIEPQQFFGPNAAGLEYGTNAFGEMIVEEVGSGPIVYEFGPSIEVGPDGIVGISYFDNNVADLVYAERSAGEDGSWTLETIDSDADVGRFSSLAYDSEGNPHISYYFSETASSGTVRHAWRDADGGWQTEDVGTLDDLAMGFTGARKITSLAIDENDGLHVMYTDRSTIIYAQRGEDGWSEQVAFESDQGNLGQLVEFALDGQGMPHVTFFDVTQPQPLLGNIIYGTAVAG